MSSDNGKPGEVDWYDVYEAANYIERKYGGSVEINLSSALETSRPHMLLCASFVGHEPARPRGAAGTYVVPSTPARMRKVPSLAHELLLALQEEIDVLTEGEIYLMPPNFVG